MQKSVLSKYDLKQLTNEALKLLKKDRSREVLILRFGLNGSRMTLEKIGQRYHITRERVRQIEKAALSKLKNAKLGEKEEYQSLFNTVIKEGILSANDAEKLFGEQNFNNIRLLLNLSPDIEELSENDHTRACFISNDYSFNTIKKITGKTVEILKEHGKPSVLKSLIPKIKETLNIELSNEIIEKAIRLSKNIVIDEDNVGLTIWPSVNPKSIKDKTHYILKKQGKPLHFSDIAVRVRTMSVKSITKQAVHNELIRDERFVLIGRGIYALIEWGYRPGTVTDIITEILTECQVLHKNDIIQKVLEKREVKETTIVLNLQNKNKFIRVGKATYSLSEE
ncbi:MAG: RNA polymerase sigma factor [candidate division CPR2 bacterium GW2011_GWC1_39_9]|uniref:RNA polymerase sigma factor n=1 Tax=candidate division CPR2 bacterium GW2011_GWC2_39_10 TaxID=1618345 RepID=A0A0G0LSD4_UNCC2|nr:MAG: RNA polymerase sigma factor [candidate division CPR2 bacterium GW2011_GWC2_39_10]KKR34584.1 MAG: RNA polymerase sigma factor [candidate division CPR2 bacterium GW2011_GWC1_39_9]